MLMAKGKNSPPNLHGPNYIRNASDVFPCGRKTLGMMLLSVLLVLVLSAYSPEQIFLYPPMPAHNSHQTAINSMLSHFFSGGGGGGGLKNCHYSYILCAIFLPSVDSLESYCSSTYGVFMCQINFFSYTFHLYIWNMNERAA